MIETGKIIKKFIITFSIMVVGIVAVLMIKLISIHAESFGDWEYIVTDSVKKQQR